MTQHKITLLPGDGIGPEVTASVVSIIECAGVDVEWEKFFVGAEALARSGDPLPAEVIESVQRNKVALKGPVTTPIGTGFSSINVRLRKTLDLYANLRPVKSMPNIITRFENVDIIVVRENTEDLYSGLEHEVVPGVVESLKIITEKASTRIARFAFEDGEAELVETIPLRDSSGHPFSGLVNSLAPTGETIETLKGVTLAKDPDGYDPEGLVAMPDGSQAMQPTRIVGVNGSRWLLRATFLGVPAVQPDDAQPWEDALAAVVVHRGTHAMPVGDPLPLVLPDDAQRLQS